RGCAAGAAVSPAAEARSGASGGRPSTGRSASSWVPCSSGDRCVIAAPLARGLLGACHAAGLPREDLLKLELDRPLELLVGAGLGGAVRPPAAELRGVSEAAALPVVVGGAHD